VPTLNEEESIRATISALWSADVYEIIVVDGGSTDRTAELATEAGSRLITGPRGRGSQLAAGAEAAAGDVLWFVHADTIVPREGTERIRQALSTDSCAGGHFETRFVGDFPAARFLTRLYRHLGLLGLRYGDSAFFADRAHYQACGGFRDIPIFEDLDLLRRLRKRGRFVRVSAEVATSSRRFEDRSFGLVFARWATMQVLYWMGVPAQVLVRIYAPVRRPGRRRRVKTGRPPSPEPSPDTRPCGPADRGGAVGRHR